MDTTINRVTKTFPQGRPAPPAAFPVAPPHIQSYRGYTCRHLAPVTIHLPIFSPPAAYCPSRARPAGHTPLAGRGHSSAPSCGGSSHPGAGPPPSSVAAVAAIAICHPHSLVAIVAVGQPVGGARQGRAERRWWASKCVEWLQAAPRPRDMLPLFLPWSCSPLPYCCCSRKPPTSAHTNGKPPAHRFPPLPGA